MTQLSPDLLSFCKKVTDKMYSSPCCKIFIDPVDPVEDEMPDYYDKIKNPQDIKAISERLDNGYYKTYEQWNHDFSLVFKNAMAYFEEKSTEYLLASSMLKKFNKLCDSMCVTQDAWAHSIVHLYSKINQLLIDSPSLVYHELQFKDLSKKVEKNELRRLSTALSNLPGKEASLELIQLLALFNIKVDFSRQVNTFKLSQMNADAIQALMIFAKDKYRENHMKFPD